ncbi:glycoside hydrolase family 12 protein [Dendrothele bispora CBS 962.96]|uniref:Glycoside hydrolase family 12 protein n=1 Tax=Dendrothele bispora (strain CBS 962.96) TaxID=1314807 RepID=A0A4S8LUG2_DENBC|nr:glycoside hydrolase family 12 protein [Dendrothele bispora CBS 962.96]
MFSKLFSVLLAFTAVSVLSTPLQKRGAVLTAQFATEEEAGGRFILENNLWGEASADSGSQSSQVTATNGNTLTWKTTYNWVDANLDLREGLGKELSAISSIPTTWTWSYTNPSSDLVADVSYDLWLSGSSSGTGASSTSTFEIMVWLSSRGGAGPAGSQIGTANVGGVTWNLFQGTVATWTVFSFVAQSEITNFNADLLPFFTFLSANHGLSTSQFLVQAQAGTEPFEGSATLSTAAYSISIN